MNTHAYLELVDGSTLSVEVDGTVDLVHRDPAGAIALGIMLTPVEARRLGEALIAVAGRAEGVIPLESPSRIRTTRTSDDAKE